jgi:acyl carrier protein
MKKIIIENKIKKIIKNYKNINFSSSEDLYQKGIIDSLDLMNIVSDLEKEFKTKLNLAKEKKFIFSINNLLKKLKY